MVTPYLNDVTFCSRPQLPAMWNQGAHDLVLIDRRLPQSQLAVPCLICPTSTSWTSARSLILCDFRNRIPVAVFCCIRSRGCGSNKRAFILFLGHDSRGKSVIIGSRTLAQPSALLQRQQSACRWAISWRAIFGCCRGLPRFCYRCFCCWAISA